MIQLTLDKNICNFQSFPIFAAMDKIAQSQYKFIFTPIIREIQTPIYRAKLKRGVLSYAANALELMRASPASQPSKISTRRVHLTRKNRNRAYNDTMLHAGVHNPSCNVKEEPEYIDLDNNVGIS